MTVLHLTNCPPALRGDLTKWLMEIAAGVYVGRVSARVRDKLWERVIDTCRGGRAVLVFSTNNEQRMDFRIHGETWEPIDFDGLKLMLRPSLARLTANQTNRVSSKKMGFSNASGFQRAKKYSKSHSKDKEQLPQMSSESNETEAQTLKTYVVVDVETTGLCSTDDYIIEVGAIKVTAGQIVDTFQSYVNVNVLLSAPITALTGITNALLVKQGKPLNSVMDELLVFLEDLPIVMHNTSFDTSFLNAALHKCGHNRLVNNTRDTLVLAKKANRGFKSYKLKDLAVELDVDLVQVEMYGYKLHSSIGDCYLTHLVFQKLMNFENRGL